MPNWNLINKVWFYSTYQGIAVYGNSAKLTLPRPYIPYTCIGRSAIISDRVGAKTVALFILGYTIYVRILYIVEARMYAVCYIVFTA